jgi:hypothetical protein
MVVPRDLNAGYKWRPQHEIYAAKDETSHKTLTQREEPYH